MTNSVVDLLDDTFHTNSIDLSRLDDLKAAISIILVIAGTAQCRADTGMDVRVIGEQALLRRMVEVRAVVDAGDLARRATEHFRLPGVEMRVEVDD